MNTLFDLICNFENKLIDAEGAAALLSAVNRHMPVGDGFEEAVDTISAALLTQMEAMREAYDRLHTVAYSNWSNAKTEDGQ